MFLYDDCWLAKLSCSFPNSPIYLRANLLVEVATTLTANLGLSSLSTPFRVHFIALSGLPGLSMRLRPAGVYRHLDKDVTRQVQGIRWAAENTKEWTTILPRDAEIASLGQADAARFRHVNRRPWSAVDGMTVAVKDNLATTSLPTSAASNILRGYSAPENATVVRLMEDAGMLVVGKTNMDEFGMGSHTQNSAFGPLANGRRHAISVGGSSGGAAMAIAQGRCHFAVGTDTGGSVRLPAAYMNLVGFKPSYGLISRYGLLPYANSLDTVGIIAKSCIDVLSLLEILSQPDHKDPTCLDYNARLRVHHNYRQAVAKRKGSMIRYYDPQGTSHQSGNSQFDQSVYDDGREPPETQSDPEPSIFLQDRVDLVYKADKLTKDLQVCKIGVPAEYNIEELQPEVRRSWEHTLEILASKGHSIVPVSLPSTQQALSAYYVLAPAEASSNLAKYDGIKFGPERMDATSDQGGVLYSGHRGEHFGYEVKRRILLGTFSLSAGAMDNYFIQAQKVRRLVQQDFNMVFREAHPLLQDAEPADDGVDFLICPTAPSCPPSIRSVKSADSLETYMNDVFTVPASLAGLPAISVPAYPVPHVNGNIPEAAIGMQIIGQYGNDKSVVHFARRFFEAGHDFNGLRRLVDGD
jgi:aspartyl-tRNA(Asn)/glutamyl-tRNA(Gln) amidotransferase subunit A